MKNRVWILVLLVVLVSGCSDSGEKVSSKIGNTVEVESPNPFNYSGNQTCIKYAEDRADNLCDLRWTGSLVEDIHVEIATSCDALGCRKFGLCTIMLTDGHKIIIDDYHRCMGLKTGEPLCEQRMPKLLVGGHSWVITACPTGEYGS